MSTIVFSNARVFDGIHEQCPEGMNVLVEKDVIREVTDKPVKAELSKPICT